MDSVSYIHIFICTSVCVYNNNKEKEGMNLRGSGGWEAWMGPVRREERDEVK